MARQPAYEPRDMYELYHTVDARNPRNFFLNHHIISDQISREALEVIWNELDRILADKVAGDVVEFGCYVGTTSVYIRRQLDRWHQSLKRTFHVYDSFEGLPEKGAQDASAAGVDFKKGALRVRKRDLLEQFRRAGLAPPVVHKAWFSDLTEDAVPEHIAFAFLDGDFYESIRDSLKLVLPKMQPHGTLIIDDYANEALPGAARAVNEFLPPNLKAKIRISHNLGIIRL